jgi:hypothetical protein
LDQRLSADPQVLTAVIAGQPANLMRILLNGKADFSDWAFLMGNDGVICIDMYNL